MEIAVTFKLNATIQHVRTADDIVNINNPAGDDNDDETGGEKRARIAYSGSNDHHIK